MFGLEARVIQLGRVERFAGGSNATVPAAKCLCMSLCVLVGAHGVGAARGDDARSTRNRLFSRRPSPPADL